MITNFIHLTLTQITILKITTTTILAFLSVLFIRNKKYILSSISIVIIIILHLSIFGFWLMDDAYITTRYAENLALDGELAFNLNETNPVEGFSTPLFLFIQAFFIKIGLSSLYLPQILSLFFLATSIVLLFFTVKDHYEDSKEINLYSFLLIALSSPYILYSISGMENTLVATLILLSVVFYNKGNKLVSSISLGLLTITRPEGVLIGIVLFIYDLIVSLKRSSDRWREFKITILNWIPLAIIFGAYFTFRILYFNSLYPNTYYAKMGGYYDRIINGIIYTLRFSTFYGLPLFILLFIIGREYIKRYSYSLTLLLTYIGFIIMAGGDLPAYRFFTYIIPLIILLSVGGFLYLQTHFKRSFICIMIFIILMMTSTTYFLSLNDYRGGIRGNRGVLIWSDRVEGTLYKLAKDIKKDAGENDKLALIDAGILPYITNLEILDMWGLMDSDIAGWKYQYSRGEIDREEHDELVVEHFYDEDVDYIAIDVIGHWREEFTDILEAGEYAELDSHHEFHSINEDERFNELYRHTGVYSINDTYHLVLFERVE